jgi:multicomponent Na+:H+ antiporter subunit B
MTPRARSAVFLAGAGGLGALLLWGLAGLPDFGHYAGPYGDVLVRVARPERNIPNVVTGVVFDWRGFDTMGEELILFAAVVGVAMILRETREHDVADVVDAVRSDAVRAAGLVAVPVTFVLALSVIAHGHLTPGGGFQGGVVASGAFVLVFLSAEYRAYHGIGRTVIWDAVEGAGAGGFVGLGLLSLALGLAFLESFLPLGTWNTLLSTGSIPLVNWASGVAVAAGFVLVYGEFLEETMAVRHGKVER